ncbi:MAG TPA: hypothetical protein VET89_02570 [Stellaceae bacterium]|nr:hypothetical protein [Stellaceae bacterium]
MDIGLLRRWLLSKALGSRPLQEALDWARRAEAFINPRPVEGAGDASTEPQNSQSPAPVEIGDKQDKKVAAAPEQAHRAATDENPPKSSSAESPDNLTVLATIHDVVRYLERNETVVTWEGENNFLVNGLYRETFDQVIERANRMRRAQELPCFVVLPTTAFR